MFSAVWHTGSSFYIAAWEAYEAPIIDVGSSYEGSSLPFHSDIRSAKRVVRSFKKLCSQQFVTQAALFVQLRGH